MTCAHTCGAYWEVALLPTRPDNLQPCKAWCGDIKRCPEIVTIHPKPFFFGNTFQENPPNRPTVSEARDTYNAPRHGWTCFHCGAHFPTTDQGIKDAQYHFGPTPEYRTVCLPLLEVVDKLDKWKPGRDVS